jgi:hypothetical protein
MGAARNVGHHLSKLVLDGKVCYCIHPSIHSSIHPSIHPLTHQVVCVVDDETGVERWHALQSSVL